MSKHNFSLSRLEEQLEPLSLLGLGSHDLAWRDSDESTSSEDRAALIRYSRPLSGEVNVHCERRSRVLSLRSEVVRLSFLTTRCVLILHQSQIQLPESTPSVEVQQYLRYSETRLVHETLKVILVHCRTKRKTRTAEWFNSMSQYFAPSRVGDDLAISCILYVYPYNKSLRFHVRKIKTTRQQEGPPLK